MRRPVNTFRADSRETELSLARSTAVPAHMPALSQTSLAVFALPSSQLAPLHSALEAHTSPFLFFGNVQEEKEDMERVGGS